MPAAPFTYDPATQAGQVRLLGIDGDPAYARYNDNEIAAFLTLSGGNVQLAAAAVLDTSAAFLLVTQGVVKFAGVLVDASKAGDALHLRAMELRREVYEGDDGTGASPVDWAEMVVDPFSYRDRLVNEMLREST